jgi:hypothetical protein
VRTRAFIFGSEKTALLQLGDHQIDKVVEPATARDAGERRNSTLAELDPGKPWTAEVNRPYPRSDGAFPEAMQQFLTLPLSDDARRKILWENCARLYAIETPAMPLTQEQKTISAAE